MAKKKKGGSITIKPPVKQKIRIGTMSKVGGVGPKKGISASKKSAFEQKHMLTAFGGAAALAYLEAAQPETVKKLDVLGIGAPATLALAAFAGGKAMKNQLVTQAATGIGALAVYKAVYEAVAPEGSPMTIAGDFEEYEEW